MNSPPQPQATQPADPDMALLFLGSWFAILHDAPKRNHAKLNALALHILGERPKTLLGLAIKACAEKWLRRQLWMVDFDILSPSEQRACVVIEVATRLSHGQAAEAKDGSSAIHFSSISGTNRVHLLQSSSASYRSRFFDLSQSECMSNK